VWQCSAAQLLLVNHAPPPFYMPISLTTTNLDSITHPPCCGRASRALLCADSTTSLPSRSCPPPPHNCITTLGHKDFATHPRCCGTASTVLPCSAAQLVRATHLLQCCPHPAAGPWQRPSSACCSDTTDMKGKQEQGVEGQVGVHALSVRRGPEGCNKVGSTCRGRVCTQESWDRACSPLPPSHPLLSECCPHPAAGPWQHPNLACCKQQRARGARNVWVRRRCLVATCAREGGGAAGEAQSETWHRPTPPTHEQTRHPPLGVSLT
jgi:hypothetical protein